MVAHTAGDLNLDPGGQVYSVTAENDIIHLAAGATLGPDPFNPSFGATRLDANPGPSWGPGLPSVKAHSSYWDPGNPALQNMGDIIAGKAPQHFAPTPEPPRR
jgi:hypothetical protein